MSKADKPVMPLLTAAGSSPHQVELDGTSPSVREFLSQTTVRQAATARTPTVKDGEAEFPRGNLRRAGRKCSAKEDFPSKQERPLSEGDDEATRVPTTNDSFMDFEQAKKNTQ